MDAVADLVHQAANPFYDWFFGGADAARAAIERQLRSPSSELAAERVAILEQEDVLAGVFIALGSAELALARKADALAAVAAASDSERRVLLARMGDTRELFEPIGPDDFYLSKIAVAERMRGRGCGRRLLTAYIEAGRAKGFSHFRLDVSSDNGAAIQLYRSAGFSAGRACRRVGLSYVPMTLASAP
jgi:ribosomal protein S18 acetylase RimI-like enzyme